MGRQVAGYGQAFGMQVSVWSQNLDPEDARQAGAEPVSKEQLFSQSGTSSPCTTSSASGAPDWSARRNWPG